MELVYLVYGISLLGSIGPALGVFIVIVTTILFMTVMYRMVGLNIESWDNESKRKRKYVERVTVDKWIKRICISLGVSVILAILIPSEKTAYMMVGAYAAQKVAENEKVQATGQKVLTIIEQKLDTYINEGVKEAQKKVEQLKDKK